MDSYAGRHLPYLGSAEHVVDLVRETNANGVVVATTGVNKDKANRPCASSPGPACTSR
jgi:hypothetical protein